MYAAALLLLIPMLAMHSFRAAVTNGTAKKLTLVVLQALSTSVSPDAAASVGQSPAKSNGDPTSSAELLDVHLPDSLFDDGSAEEEEQKDEEEEEEEEEEAYATETEEGQEEGDLEEAEEQKVV